MNRMKTLQGPPRVYIAGKFRGLKNQDVQRHIDVASWFRAPIAETGCFPVCVHIGEGLSMHDVQQGNAGAFWLDVTLDEMRTCDAVVLVPGWHTSSGTFAEVREAMRLGMPVFEAVWADGPVIAFDTMPTPAPIGEWMQVNEMFGEPGDAFADFHDISFEIWADSILGVPTMPPAPLAVGDTVTVNNSRSNFHGKTGRIVGRSAYVASVIVAFPGHPYVPFKPLELTRAVSR